ncbi:MAG: hypothetical protein AAFZ87_09650, partial [Planctomycetota bacterium]
LVRAQELRVDVRGALPDHLVDRPEVVLPSQSSGARLLHVHENRPGMLGAINEVIGESSANVDAQFLRTYEDVGYVVTDVDLGREEALRLEGALRRVEGTLRSRVLF